MRASGLRGAYRDHATARATVTTTIESAPAHFKARAHASAVAPEVNTSSNRRIDRGTVRPRGTRNAPATFSRRRIPGRPAWGTRSRALDSASGSNGRPRCRERRDAMSAGRLNPRRKYFQGWTGTGTTVGGSASGIRSLHLPVKAFAEAAGDGVDRVGASRVFRRHDRGANVSRVGKEGAGGVERREGRRRRGRRGRDAARRRNLRRRRSGGTRRRCARATGRRRRAKGRGMRPAGANEASRIQGSMTPAESAAASSGGEVAQRPAEIQRRVAETAYSRLPWSMAYPFHVPQEGHRAVHLMVEAPQEEHRKGMRYLRL